MFEYIIIAILVIWSCFVFFNKVAPNTAKKLYTALADSLEKQGLTAIAKKIRPAMSSGGGCGGSCGCGSSSKTKPKQHTEIKATEINPVKWK